MLQASIEALNAPGYAAAYRAALSEIRENLLKVRMAALIVAYKQTILAQARADLGLDEAPLHDSEAQVRIHLHALEMHGVELHLPALPPGYDETGLPITLGDLVKQKGTKP
jgi:hypothetical protein